MFIDEIARDVRYAFRSFARNRGFTAVILITLALGIGANTAIFSLMESVLLRPLPVDKPAELTMLLRQQPGREANAGFTNPLWEALRDQEDVFSAHFAWSTPQQFQFAQSGQSSTLDGFMASGDYFTTLGIGP